MHKILIITIYKNIRKLLHIQSVNRVNENAETHFAVVTLKYFFDISVD